MKRIESIKTLTYEYNNDFMVDIVLDEAKKEYGVWMCKKTYGVKSLVWGSSLYNQKTQKEITIDDIIYLIENGNFANDIQIYMQMYGDNEDFIDFESYAKDGYSNTIKITIPENGGNPGENIFVLINDEVKKAYDNDEDSTVYTGILIDRSILYPLETCIGFYWCRWCVYTPNDKWLLKRLKMAYRGHIGKSHRQRQQLPSYIYIYI